jgi:hypothetical protein
VNPPDGGGLPITAEPPADDEAGGGVLPIAAPPAPLDGRVPSPGALDAPDEQPIVVNAVNTKKSA